MDDVIINQGISAERFCDIQESVGFGRPDYQQTALALKHSLYVVRTDVDGKTVGMGRLIGDMARIVYIQDLFIMPEYQRKGIGTLPLNALMEFIKANAMPGTSIVVALMAAKGKEPFYAPHGFHIRPNDHEGSGMQMRLQIPARKE